MDKGREGVGILEILTFYLAVYGHHSKPHEEKNPSLRFPSVAARYNVATVYYIPGRTGHVPA